MSGNLYKLSYWQGSSGRWYCADVSNFSANSAKWYITMRALSLSIDEYVDLLTNKFNVRGLRYNKDSDCLLFHFDSQEKVMSFCSYVNKIAKKNNFYL